MALLEWFSRHVLAWELTPSLETLHCVRVLEAALADGLRGRDRQQRSR